MKMNTTRTSLILLGAMVLGLCLPTTIRAQVILEERFTGGASTTGFTIVSQESDCDWTFAPGGLTATTFSVDGVGELPSGPGFDGDFAFLDSDACGGTDVVVNSFLVSPPFDASGAANVVLSYSHQFQARLQSFCKVEVYNGSVWSQVALYTGTSVGYPNPAAETEINITSEAGGSAVAQIRFQFSSGWDWWWALDAIQVTAVECYFPGNLAVADLTTAGSATISWTDNGSFGYEWVVTTGAVPDGTNTVTSGTGTNTAATGLSSGVPYTVFVRAECAGGGEFSVWSEGVNFAIPINGDQCATAFPLVVNTDYECGSTTAGTITDATPSGITSTCGGTADDDVWFSFTALTTTHRVSLLNIAGSTTDLYHALWTGNCDALTLVALSCSDPEVSDPLGLVIGQVYYLQVYSWTGVVDQNATFDVCIGSDPSIGIAERAGQKPLTVFPNPVTDHLSLRDVDVRAHHLTILDATGRMVMQYAAARTIDVQQLPPGTYLMMMVGKDGSIMGRTPFVKDR